MTVEPITGWAFPRNLIPVNPTPTPPTPVVEYSGAKWYGTYNAEHSFDNPNGIITATSTPFLTAANIPYGRGSAITRISDGSGFAVAGGTLTADEAICFIHEFTATQSSTTQRGDYNWSRWATYIPNTKFVVPTINLENCTMSLFTYNQVNNTYSDTWTSLDQVQVVFCLTPIDPDLEMTYRFQSNATPVANNPRLPTSGLYDVQDQWTMTATFTSKELATYVNYN